MSPADHYSFIRTRKCDNRTKKPATIKENCSTNHSFYNVIVMKIIIMFLKLTRTLTIVYWLIRGVFMGCRRSYSPLPSKSISIICSLFVSDLPSSTIICMSLYVNVFFNYSQFLNFKTIYNYLPHKWSIWKF